jgi:hypothetical protein
MPQEGQTMTATATVMRHQRVRLAYQPPASSTFLSQQTSHQQPASSTFLSEQTSTSHQPPAKRTGSNIRGGDGRGGGVVSGDRRARSAQMLLVTAWVGWSSAVLVANHGRTLAWTLSVGGRTGRMWTPRCDGERTR